MWRFFLTAVDGPENHGYQWKWERDDRGVRHESANGFATYDACVVDARLHGICEEEVPDVATVLRESRRNAGY